MTIKETHDRIYFILNKEQVGYVPHDKIDLSLDMAQMDYFNTLYGDINEMRNGRVLRIGYGMNQKIHDDLATFKNTIFYNKGTYGVDNIYGTGDDGVLVVPANYMHVTAMRSITGTYNQIASYSFTAGVTSQSNSLNQYMSYKIRVRFDNGAVTGFRLKYGVDTIFVGDVPTGILELYYTLPYSGQDFIIDSPDSGVLLIDILSEDKTNRIEMLNDDQIWDRLNSDLLPIDDDNLICSTPERHEYVNGINVSSVAIQLYPAKGHDIWFQYLRRPNKPVFAYTQSGREITYDDANSIHLEWPDAAIDKYIIPKAVQYISTHLKSGFDIGAAQSELKS